MGEGEKPRSEEQKRVEASAEADRARTSGAAVKARQIVGRSQRQQGFEPQAAGEKDRSLSRRSFGAAISLGFRVLVEFVSARDRRGVVGWQLDKWFGTSPAFLARPSSPRDGGGILERISHRRQTPGPASPERSAAATRQR